MRVRRNLSGAPSWAARCRWSIAIAAAFFSLALARHAQADASPANQAAAQALFDQGRRLVDLGNFAEACPKFEASQRLDPGTGTLLNLATCNERVGKIATAWTEFNEALSLAIRDGRRDRVAFAREHIASIEPQLPRLTLSVRAPGTEGLSVTIDGAPFGKAAWDVKAPIDPGGHTIEATAPGKLPFRAVVKLAPTETRTVEIPALDDDPNAQTNAAAPASGFASEPTAAPAPAPGEVAPPPEPKGNAARRLAGEIALGAGAVGLAIGAYFGLQAMSTWSDANANCPNDACSPHGESLTRDARNAARGADVALGIGVAAVGAGVVLILTARGGQSSQPALAATLTPHPHGGGLVLHGAF